MARFAEHDYMHRDWPLLTPITISVVLLVSGLWLSETVAVLDPFFAPAVVGFLSGLIFAGLSFLTQRVSGNFEGNTQNDDTIENDQTYVPDRWMKGQTFSAVLFIAAILVTIFWLYPKVRYSAVVKLNSHQAWVFGLWSFGLVDWAFNLMHGLFSPKRASQ